MWPLCLVALPLDLREGAVGPVLPLAGDVSPTSKCGAAGELSIQDACCDTRGTDGDASAGTAVMGMVPLSVPRSTGSFCSLGDP